MMLKTRFIDSGGLTGKIWIECAGDDAGMVGALSM
jgi:hypothetical protein